MKNIRTINHKITNDELCYLAGIIDSSSSFFLSQHACGRKNPSTGKRDLRWVAGIIIQNTNHMLAKIISSIIFLGDTHIHTTDLDNGFFGRRLLKSIRITGPVIETLLPKIVKILKVKKEHANILIEFRETVIGNGNKYNSISYETELQRIKLKERLRYLNSPEYKDTVSSPIVYSKHSKPK